MHGMVEGYLKAYEYHRSGIHGNTWYHCVTRKVNYIIVITFLLQRELTMNVIHSKIKLIGLELV
jgi:hypothetical protein